jgi:hypothetical protein
MKTKAVGSRLALLAIAITATLLTGPVLAQTAPHQLVVTENSSTSTGLTATYDGSAIAVTFIGPDHWTVTVPSTVFFIPGGGFNWVEPGNSGLGNAVILGSPGNPRFSVTSDTTTNFGLVADESTVNVGTDTSNGGSISMTFDDDAATAEAVPDTGTTGSLLGLSLMGLAFFRRKLC